MVHLKEVKQVKKREENIVYVGKEKKQHVFLDAIKFGFGFYIGFNMGRMIKRAFIITNISK